MVHFQDTYTPGSPRMQDWSTEITPPGQRRAPVMVGTEPGRNTTGMTVPAQTAPPALSDMQNDLPVEVIQAVLDDRAVVVDAAARGVAALRAQLDGDVVEGVREGAVVERAHELDHKLARI